MIQYSPFMELALNLAQKAAELDEVPVGAVIVEKSSGNILAEAHNLVEKLSDPTAHAEMLAIQEATKKIGTSRLSGCDMYVTLEPCPMCAQAISFARLDSVYYGAYDPKGGGVDHGAHIFNSSSCHHKPEIYGGIYENQCGNLLKEFFAKKR